MTYCVGISLQNGLVFASDSRTNAGTDRVSTYSKLHTISLEGDRQLVLLSSGNLATTQAVVTQVRRDLKTDEEHTLRTVRDMSEAADYLGQVSREKQSQHSEDVMKGGFNPEASFILGGQIGKEPPAIYLIYPEGNHITTSLSTPYLQVGETKYGKPILDRIINYDINLEDAARCALVSMDSTMNSNVGVGPPIEVLLYQRDSLTLNRYLRLDEDAPYLTELRRSWSDKLTQAFSELPRFNWELAGPPPAGE